MNTWNMNSEDFDVLSEEEQTEVAEAIQHAELTGQLCCVRVAAYDGDGYTYLYGVYVNTPEWVADYYQNGGTWGYS